MSTLPPPLLRTLAADWEKRCGLPTALFSGIVGNNLHIGGYHISRQDQPSTNYSVKRPGDRLGPANMASAIDMSMSPADMKTCTARLVRAYADKTDPRRKYINAFNGWDGSGDAMRWDVYGQTCTRASPDHKWHIHLSIKRMYVASATAMRAILSILKGESKAAYLASIAPKPKPPPVKPPPVVVKPTPVVVPVPPPPPVVAKPPPPVAKPPAVKPPAVKPPAAKPPVAPVVPKFPGELKRNDAQKKAIAPLVIWQRRTVSQGWTSLGRPDGFYGEKTENVVRAMQAQHRIGVDGRIGPKTWPLPWR